MHLPDWRAPALAGVQLELLREAAEARAVGMLPQSAQHLLRVHVRVLPLAARLLRNAPPAALTQRAGPHSSFDNRMTCPGGGKAMVCLGQVGGR